MSRAGNVKNVGRHYSAKTRVARVAASLTNNQLKRLPELLELMELYEDRCISTPSRCNDRFLQFMEEVHILLSEE